MPINSNLSLPQIVKTTKQSCSTTIIVYLESKSLKLIFYSIFHLFLNFIFLNI